MTRACSTLWTGKRYDQLKGHNCTSCLPWTQLNRDAQELIKVRGAQVAPAELEALLLEHPLVVDAAVVGCTMWVSSSVKKETKVS